MSYVCSSRTQITGGFLILLTFLGDTEVEYILFSVAPREPWKKMAYETNPYLL